MINYGGPLGDSLMGLLTQDDQSLPAMQGLMGGGMPQPYMGGQNPYGQPPQTPQGMGLVSPFFTERPQQALPTQGFTPSRVDAMGPNAMAMLGMNPNMPNMVGPTSALPPEMQPQASQLRMYGMEDQMAQPTPGTGGGGAGGGGGGTFPGGGAEYFPAVANELIKRGPDGRAYMSIPGRMGYQDPQGNVIPKNTGLWSYLQQMDQNEQALQGGE